jgi:hypothetical protein
VDPPLVPSALDDEFDSGSPDLALRGWTVRNAAGTAMTRVGDIEPWNPTPTGLTTTTYRSSLIRSQIQIQLVAGGTLNFWKPVSGVPTGGMYWARLGTPAYFDLAATQTSFMTLAVFQLSGGNYDGNNRVFASISSSGTSSMYTASLGRVSGGTVSQNLSNASMSVADIYGVKLKNPTTDWSPFYADSADGSTVSSSFGAVVSTNIGGVGITLGEAAGSPPNNVTSRIFSIDFFRSAAGANAWIGQTPKVSVTGTYAGLPTGNPYVDPPAVASSFDDEFESGSPNLATRGWTIKIGTTTLTRAGDVVPYSPTGPAAGTYWSTLIGSSLFIQVQYGQVAHVYKAVSLAAGDTYFARVGLVLRTDVGTALWHTEVGLYALSGGAVDNNNRVYVAQFANGGNRMDYYRASGGGYSGAGYNLGSAVAGDIRGIRYANAPDAYYAFSSNAANGDTEGVALSAPNASALSVAAFNVNAAAQPSIGGWVPYMTQIDFFRKVSGTNWIAQQPRPVLWNVVNGNIDSYSPKATPVAADQIYLADSGASNAIRRATLAAIAEASSVPLRYRNIYLDPPSSPDVFNDEFDSGSADLAVRGWTIVNRGSGATLTRTGDVDFTINASTIGATVYRSTIRNSRLYIQASVQALIYKSATGSFQLASLFNQPNVFSGNYCNAVISNNNTPGIAATNRSVYTGQEGANVVFAYNNQGSFTIPFNSAYGGVGQGIVAVLDYSDATKLAQAYLQQPYQGTMSYNGYSGIGATSMSSVFAGISFTTASAQLRNWVEIDYIRRYAVGDWFPA